MIEVNIWDPAVGSGFAGFLVTRALASSGAHVRYRGQDLNADAVAASERRFENEPDAEFVVGNTLERDEVESFRADLVIVDAPWGMSWESSGTAVEARAKSGAFQFGLPQRSDSTWLFISMALQKLRTPSEGGGRVTALVNPGVLWRTGASAEIRRQILETGLLESVTRLPDGLAPNTSIPLFLLTFTNRSNDVARGKAMIADLQTQFTTQGHRRVMRDAAFRELASGLSSRKPGPRNRIVELAQFTRREARLSRATSSGNRLSWSITTYNDTAIDDRLLEARYGRGAGVGIVGDAREVVDLDPSHILGDDTRELLSDLEAKAWPPCRLSGLLATVPEVGQRRGR